MSDEKWTESKLFALLEERFPAPSYACFPQVGNGTGTNQSRWADALVMSLWPSQGLGLEGFEIKVSRSDWRRELKDPEKAESIAQYCRKWWIVAPKGVVPKDELPEAWGLLEANKGKLRKAKAPKVTKAKPLNQSFIAALLRAAQCARKAERAQWIPRAEIETEVQKSYEAGLASGQVEARRHIGAYESLRASVRAFEDASGVKIDLYDGGRIGEAVQAVLSSPTPNATMTRIRRSAEIEHERWGRFLRSIEAHET